MQTQFGKYELKRPLGSGASGTVYCAIDTFSGREVALKVFDQKVLHKAQVGERARGQFMSEAALAGRLAHPHIAAIYEAVLQEDSGYVAMEYVPGGNLLKFIQPDGLLPVNEVIQIGFKSCSALDYAFRQGIIHRDIKPANILVTQGANIKLADFGSALLGATRPDRLVGTPRYMSPEQARGGPLDQYSDMYAMGVVLYELLTGRRPFTGTTTKEIFHSITTTTPSKPSSMRPEVPAALDAIVLRMMSKRPQDRYPTWAELALTLAEVGKLSIYRQDIADSERFGRLRESEVFGKLKDGHLWELVHSGRWSRFPARTPILHEDEAGHSLFLLAAGEVKVTKRGRLLDVLKAGECFGEMGFVRRNGAIREATVEAMTDVLVGEFDPAALSLLTAACRLEIAEGLLRTMVERLSLANTRLTQVAPAN